MTTLSLTEFQELSALRTFLLSVLPEGVPVIRGQVNRVPEPKADDFVIYWPLSQNRLATNITDWTDTIFIGGIVKNVLTVYEVTQDAGPIVAGIGLSDGASGKLAANTKIVKQLSGPVGDVGTYEICPAQSVAAETMYCGIASALEPTEWMVQCDVHGPKSADNVKIIETLFRSEYGCDAFSDSGYDIQPLYADDAVQLAFFGGENQYDDRWTLTMRMQINPVVGSPQQFATAIDVTVYEVDAEFPA